MSHDTSYDEIVRRMKLDFPITFTVPDLFTGAPITIARENVLTLLLIDRSNPVLEAQLVSPLYAEMARFKRATEAATSKAESAFRKWKARMGHECAKKTPEKTTTTGKKSAKQGPTTAEVETYYRTHKDYDLMHDEAARLKAIAGLFEDLMWSFKMKAEMLVDTNRVVGGYQATDRRGDDVAQQEAGTPDRLADYVSLAEEAASLADDDSVAVAKRMASEVQQPVSATPTKQARSLD